MQDFFIIAQQSLCRGKMNWLLISCG